ncbi:MAG: transcription-repair coupling factor [Chloroflexi bacterium]|nr:transcription-repair coupling factor [Chloroflexota bacterium]
MHLTGLLALLRTLPAYQALLGQPEPTPQALLAAARPYIVAGLKTDRPGPLILLTARSEMAQQFAHHLESWLPPIEQGGPPVYLFAEPDALPYERIAWSGHTRQQRLTAMAALQSRTGPKPVVIASARALMQKTLPARELRLALRPLKMGSIMRLDQMALNWAQTGYNPVETVEEPGTFARRGGIVDIWPPNLSAPIRIDLFGDEVESIRLFDPATQRSDRKLEIVEIGPGSEVLTKYGAAVLTRLGVQGENLDVPSNEASPLRDPNLLLAIREEIRLEVEHLRQGQSFHGIEWYLPYFYDQPASLLDYVTPETTVVVDDALDLFATLSELETQAATLREELQHSGELPQTFASSFFTSDELRQKLAESNPILLGYGDLYSKASSTNTPLARSFAPAPRFGGKAPQFIADIVKHQSEGHATVLVTRQAARLHESLREENIVAHVQSDITQLPKPRTVSLVQGVLGEGFVGRGFSDASQEGVPSTFNLHFFTDTELFGWSKPQARRGSHHQSTVAPEIFFADVKAGEFVVHLEHGIGQYDGLVKLEIGTITREYLQVSYAHGDKLYVPVHQADRLSRYVGAGEKTPPVNRLGTADWQVVKDRARRAVADIADDLLKLYAEREVVHRHIYSPDGPWQEEMEASFPYEETDDQLRAIEDVKRDMESDRPMDRLIVGDVGYGKTEVGVRAAFKAIVDGKQVAMLVPTTVLAQQHYRTISRRLSRFPVRVEMLSRFRTPAQQEKIIQGLREGSIDFVVGTHRLLSNDIEFKDLGMLIVDEEQRFGVSHKERIKQMRAQVDVLTLSATPIPRTLHMSLSGVRDMSTINTPPKERLPIHTVLAEYDEVLIRQAVQREINRKGQVFVVHDRIRGLHYLGERIQHLVPEARIAVAHGQMPERELEDMMLMFSEGQYDVLVATTIIENGLDIPNANTILINRSDHFGLAQLYQLRGRVGRSTQRGHCYLLYDKHTSLSYDARRRLSAIMESSEELGAGFRIAMRDLEIRGAGDLLGARQHGHIDSVGFDLYTRLLAQAINEAKHKKERFEKALEGEAGDDKETGLRRELSRTGQGEGETGSEGENEDDTTLTVQSALDLETPFDIADPLAPPVTLDLPIDAKIPQTYIENEALRLQMYRRIAGISHPEIIDEMRQELLDRFGKDDETQSVPEEVENLLFQIRIKILALRAGVTRIGRELDQLVLHSEALENMNRPAMQRRLRQGLGQLDDVNINPEEAARVARRAIYLPIDETGHWRTALVRTLEIMAFS